MHGVLAGGVAPRAAVEALLCWTAVFAYTSPAPSAGGCWRRCGWCSPCGCLFQPVLDGQVDPWRWPERPCPGVCMAVQWIWSSACGCLWSWCGAGLQCMELMLVGGVLYGRLQLGAGGRLLLAGRAVVLIQTNTQLGQLCQGWGQVRLGVGVARTAVGRRLTTIRVLVAK